MVYFQYQNKEDDYQKRVTATIVHNADYNALQPLTSQYIYYAKLNFFFPLAQYLMILWYNYIYIHHHLIEVPERTHSDLKKRAQNITDD